VQKVFLRATVEQYHQRVILLTAVGIRGRQVNIHFPFFLKDRGVKAEFFAHTHSRLPGFEATGLEVVLTYHRPCRTAE
jgi:hypothetical protein